MDRAERITQELNHACSTSSSGLTTTPDSSDSESEGNETEEIVDSDGITLEIILRFQLTLTHEEDDEESFGLAADELECKISEDIIVTKFEEDRDSEMEKIHNCDCKCYGRRKENSSLGTQSCSCKLSPELMYNIWMDSLAAVSERQDMRIIGPLESNRRRVETSAMTTSTKKTPTKRKHARTTHLIRDIEVCNNTFQFLMGVLLGLAPNSAINGREVEDTLSKQEP
ncbi:hypothetical protein CRENBAI_023216 [Crenichthys baileyi]|uniref:Uncharacterized protein n=1 Tax=Crenichthys baileyi TaxID=28760 RepID=A0AAV9S362_9TELE